MRRNGRPRRPRTRLCMVLDLLKSWTAIGASRRIERLTDLRAAYHMKSVVSRWNVFLVVLDRSLISSRRKRRAGHLLQKMREKNV